MAATLVGWREWCALPELGIAAIKVKIDTGARTSSLHVERLEEFSRDNERWVRFELIPRSRKLKTRIVIETPVVDERPVTDSGGNRGNRLFIRTRIVIAGHSWPIEINLTNRRGMLFPMLLGRTAIAGHLYVDPARSFMLGGAADAPGKATP
ncbi:MAG TPA: RimK/LysX family protein [Xanthomonadales bacterium]|nr:RimK/LysX family protein [Xanthomonadales bacterium]